MRVPDYHSIATEYITLIDVLAERHDDDLAHKIGRAWAEKMRILPDDREPIDRLHGLLRDNGFDPEPAGEGEITLHSCPFIRSDGTQPGRFVCAIHPGMLQAMVPEGMQVTLTPLSGQAQCHIRLG